LVKTQKYKEKLLSQAKTGFVLLGNCVNYKTVTIIF